MIKKICVLMTMLTAIAGHASAEESSLKMAFQTNEGNVLMINANSLSMSIISENLVATNGSEQLELKLADLAKMYFTEGSSGNIIVAADLSNEAVEIFSLEGINAGKFNSLSKAVTELPGGIYVVKTKSNKTFKIQIQ